MSALSPTSALTSPLKKAGISKTGADYAVNALDTFHDFPTPIAGLPDDKKGRSVIYDIRQQLTIDGSGIDGVTGEDLWDCHIAFIPATAQSQLFANDVGSSGVAPVSTGTDAVNGTMYGLYDVGGATSDPIMSAGWNANDLIVVCKVPAGDPTFNPIGSGAAYPRGISIPQLLDTSRSRLISGAFEVHNVTPELYKGGTVTDYSVDDAPVHSGFLFGGVTNGGVFADRRVDGIRMQAPPSTLAIATQINGLVRDAAAGTYTNLRIEDTEGFDAAYPAVGTVVLETGIIGGAYAGQTVGFATHTNLSGANVTDGVATYRQHNFQQCGSYFTGLSSKTVLNLSFEGLVERFPEPGSAEMPLASPSAPYDPRALAFVHQVQEKMPNSVPVADNDLGKLFKTIVKVAKGVSKGIAAIPGLPPQISGVANAVNMGSTVLDDALYADETEPSTPRLTGRARRRNTELRDIVAKDTRIARRAPRKRRRQRRN